MFLTSYALIQDHQLEWSNTGGYINAIPIKLYQCTKLKFGNLSTSWLMREQEELQVAKHRDENAKSKLLNFQRCFFKSRWWLRGPVGALLNILSDRQLEMIFNLFFTNGMNAPFFFCPRRYSGDLSAPHIFYTKTVVQRKFGSSSWIILGGTRGEGNSTPGLKLDFANH